MLPANFPWFWLLIVSLALFAGSYWVHQQYPDAGWLSRVLLALGVGGVLSAIGRWKKPGPPAA